jgi:hypothetical protein
MVKSIGLVGSPSCLFGVFLLFSDGKDPSTPNGLVSDPVFRRQRPMNGVLEGIREDVGAHKKKGV